MNKQLPAKRIGRELLYRLLLLSGKTPKSINTLPEVP